VPRHPSRLGSKRGARFELLMGFSVRAGPRFPFDRDPMEVASDRPLTLDDWFSRVTRVVQPSSVARCLFR
jgi:hypothetical protein